MSAVFLINLFLISFLFQSTLMQYASFGGVRPDLILLLACLGGLFFGRQRGLTLGALAGLIQDCLSGGIFGLNTLSKSLIGFATGVLQRHVGFHHRLLQALLVALLTAFDALLTFGVARLFQGGELSLLRLTGALVAYQIVYNGFVAIPYFAVLSRLARRFLPTKGFTDLPAAPPGLRRLLQRKTYGRP
ncbi:MAG: rod shape-determining protein MreD [bacterium]|nr:rod shape-determining protein MreD [bacterium]